jgi:hypothetical protein
MYLTPFRAKLKDVRDQITLDAPYLFAVKAVRPAQFGGTVRAVQNEYGFAISSDDMDMSRSVIVGVDHHP